MLKEEHRVVVADRSLHQPLGICRRAASHNFDARYGMEIGLKALTMFCSQLTAHASWSTHHCGNREIATTGVSQHPHVVGDLIERQKQEAHIHAFHDWPQASHGSTNSHTRETVFSNWRVEDTQLTVFLVEVLGDLV